jgi:arabinose-5-phosphate isomerase
LSGGARDEIVERAREIVDREARAVAGLRGIAEQPGFAGAVETLGGCAGRILVSGVGKTGIIGQRIAASFRSTGAPAYYIHPVEALHGDLGLVDPSDVALLLSRSGETEELLLLLPALHRLGVPVVSAVGRPDSTLARRSRHAVVIGPVEEIPDLGEFPTVSTTLFQVLGDLLTVLVFRHRGLLVSDLRFLHPGGVLGRQAALKVSQVMHTGSALPKVGAATPLRDALLEIMEKRLGMTCVVGDGGDLLGILTDGDIKRILHRHGSVDGLAVADVMTAEPRTIGPDELLVTALARMEANPAGGITSLIVTDAQGVPIGVVHIHDILRAVPPPA